MNVEGMLVGNRVVVRSASEILSTLDADGTLDGLPFMPEMLDWCGKSFRIQRRVDKTCVEGHPMRRFPANDVVVLDSPRCDGSSHDGCKHGCRIYWKHAWLRAANDDASRNEEIQSSNRDTEQLRSRIKVKSDELRYFCQSTELLRSTEVFPPGRHRRMRVALTEIRNGDIGIFQALQLFALFIRQRILRMLGYDNLLRGPHERTPKQSLNLQPGELVRVKSRAEIVKTLDRKMSNRGLGLCHEMMRYCGHETKVRYRVDRLINETTGVMRELTDSVTLNGVEGCGSLGEECLCPGEPGDCPRGELMYWREIWLERVSSQ
ncbi:hypothetical protein WI604_25510 [Bradyrhizobium symbiodeficiens]|uniref:hypothetical protein n=1 Tax=Bradyrhizobium symbiodeficiens TaxID=1404367 RepID=UPI0030D57B9B